MTRRRTLPTLLLAAWLATAGCGGGSAAPADPAADVHPCDLLTEAEAAGILDVDAVTEAGLMADPVNGSQASCTWTATDGSEIALLVEGPVLFAAGAAPYADAAAGYEYWRDDTQHSGFAVVDLEGAGDAAFTPLFGPGPANAIVVLTGDHLVHLSMLGEAGEARLIAAAKLVSAALGSSG